MDMSLSRDGNSSSAALKVLEDVAAYLQTGLGADDTLRGVLGVLHRAFDLQDCCIWVQEHGGSGYSAIVPPGRDPPGEAERDVATQWLNAPGSPADDDGLKAKYLLGNDENSLGLLEAVLRADRHPGVQRSVLQVVANILSPWLASTRLAEDLATEVTYRTREAEAQRRFTTKIIDSLPVGLYVIDRDYCIQAWNQKREHGPQGLPRAVVIGKEVFNVLSRQPRNLLKGEFDRVFETGAIEQIETGSTSLGEKRQFRISKIPMRLHDDEITHVITIGEDITEWRHVQHQIGQTEKLAGIGQLAAGVMHELNNPLATIGVCGEALTLRLDEIPAGARASFEEYLGMIESELTRCQAIIDGLLDFSHPKAQAKTSTVINEVVDNALFLIKHHERLGRIGLVSELADGLPVVEANEKQLIQVFLSLMINGIDAMDGAGKLSVRTGWNPERKDEVMVEFSDTGAGIQREDLSKIFEPFFTTKGPGRGTGLGLSICYGIVQQHRGRIVAHSEMGTGTTFRVFLPVRVGDAGEAA